LAKEYYFAFPPRASGVGGLGSGFEKSLAERTFSVLRRALEAQVDSDGGPNDLRLRKYWRGRMGLSKDEQLEFFECGCLPNVAGEDSDEIDELESKDKANSLQKN
jgi:hypothetical protein